MGYVEGSLVTAENGLSESIINRVSKPEELLLSSQLDTCRVIVNKLRIGELLIEANEKYLGGRGSIESDSGIIEEKVREPGVKGYRKVNYTFAFAGILLTWDGNIRWRKGPLRLGVYVNGCKFSDNNSNPPSKSRLDSFNMGWRAISAPTGKINELRECIVTLPQGIVSLESQGYFGKLQKDNFGESLEGRVGEMFLRLGREHIL